MAGTIFDLYQKFAAHIVIPSRDLGLTRYKPFATQTYIVKEILDGIQSGIHDFVFLKPRQIGASTACMTFDLFWMLYNKGLQGAIITQDDEAKFYFADVLKEMARSLPPQWTPPLRVSNRIQTAWMQTADHKRGGGRLMYLHAGRKGGLGRGRGLSFGHFTEISRWSSEEDAQALRASLSESHPAACYLWESTANGFNFFYDMWKIAQRSKTTKAIFVGWWLHDLYRVAPDTKVFKTYWARSPKLIDDERIWAKRVLKEYGVEIQPEQWAWYRWKFEDKMFGDLNMMHQEFPTLPEHAFQASGMGFLGSAAISKLREDLAASGTPACYRYSFGPDLEHTSCLESVEPQAQLKIWEEPKENVRYVLAADPAFGASETSDRSTITVWRATMGQLVQVAEFSSNEIGTKHFAWVCMHLCGYYTPAHFIQEINGPGYSVLQEIQQMMNFGYGTSKRAALQNVLMGVQHYIFRRPDSMSKGSYWHWKTGANNKPWIMASLRERILSGNLVIRSGDLVEELNAVRQDGDKYEAHGSAHDDRVITAALAVQAWVQQALPYLSMVGEGPAGEEGKAPVIQAGEVHTQLLQDFFASLR